MASVVNDPKGKKRILFVDQNEVRKTIRLGRCPRKTALGVCRHVEALLLAKKTGEPLVPATVAWLAKQAGVKLRRRLALSG